MIKFKKYMEEMASQYDIILDVVTISESAETALKNKAEKTGMPLGILKQVYKRGLAA